MDQKKTKYKANWTLADLTAMIKWKAPKRPNVPKEREGLEIVWNEVKDLDLPTIEQRWSQQDEEELAEFGRNGRYTIERTHIMRRAERREGKKQFQLNYLLLNQEILSR